MPHNSNKPYKPLTNKVQDLVDLTDQAFNDTERTQAENLWSELTEYINNNDFTDFFNAGISSSIVGQGSTTSGAAGAKKTQRIFDGTAGRAATTLSSSIHGILTNPASPWADIKFSGDTEDLNKDQESVAALSAAVRDIRTKIQESNFSDAMLKVYMSHVVLGNAALLVEVKSDGSFRFTPLHMSQVAWMENMDGRVDTVFRKVNITLKQAFERWGDALPDDMLVRLPKEPMEKVDIIHIIAPRMPDEIRLNEDGLAHPNFRPFASYYVDMNSKVIIEEGGFYEMPILGVRYHTMPGEVYGRGPGHLALPDVRTLNKLKELALEAETLRVKPPILANRRDLIGGQLRMRPGGITVMQNIDGIKPWTIGGRDQSFQITVEELVKAINESFFLDKLLLPPRTETGEMTAFEVAERIKQTNTVLGPVLARVNNELLQPLIMRMFMVKLRAGEINLTPAMKIHGANIQVIFNNQLAQAQRIQDVTTIHQWIQSVGALAQINPEVADNVDADQTAEFIAITLGVPHEAVRDRKEVAQVRAERAEQLKQQQLMENAAPLADAASKINDINQG